MKKNTYSIRLDEWLHYQLKINAVKEKKTFSDYVEEILKKSINYTYPDIAIVAKVENNETNIEIQ